MKFPDDQFDSTKMRCARAHFKKSETTQYSLAAMRQSQADKLRSEVSYMSHSNGLRIGKQR